MAARIRLILLLAATALTALSISRMFGGVTDINNVVSNEMVQWQSTNVGGATDINNVESNKMVQSLGKFAVENYNRNQEKNKAPPTTMLSFSHVIAARWQSVEGSMYYLKIVAEDSHHARKVFDAKVIEQLWLNSTELISFKPSAH